MKKNKGQDVRHLNINIDDPKWQADMEAKWGPKNPTKKITSIQEKREDDMRFQRAMDDFNNTWF